MKDVSKHLKSINDFSLLYPMGKENSFQKLSEIVCNDLSIDYICSFLSKKENEQRKIRGILTDIPNDEEVITYRSMVYKDLKNHPEFCIKVEEALEEIELLNEYGKTKKDWDSSNLWELVSRLKELEVYIECIKKLKSSIELSSFESEGLKNLNAYVNGIYNDSGFSEFQEDVEKIGYDISAIKSISLGVNLDENLNPIEAGIVSINSEAFKGQTFLKNFLTYHKKRSSNNTSDLFQGMTYFKHTASNGINPLMNNLTKIVENMLQPIVKDLKKTLKKYMNVSGLALVNIADEIRFYIRFLELEKKIKDIGLPVCIGQTNPINDSECKLEDFYNIKLAICKLKGEIQHDIIRNDLIFTKDQRIFILTGPNRGGKTIFTQGIGLAFLFFNSGVFIPCANGVMKPCDNIFTHFPADENSTVEMGRLGEESNRLSDICGKATSKSLILFNESFATTSHTESLFIAKDVVKYLCYLGARTCFNTHIHELAESVEEINKEIDAAHNAVSLVMGLENGERSFKVKISKPQGISFARDIAYKYGITFEQLKNRRIIS
ncbi:MutS-like protein [Natranaerovirga pectinivora]|uniref:MutS-like protein n=1 Tax=Natranaerovirga pectinivora TaxID=682400 RepID=A0A4R3MIX1_9FIRM|nr:hypothetical protein [Natranaerovirga pectinivora]TCT13953.1 MutS-like protein [Natranaerovirga pectinivora]